MTPFVNSLGSLGHTGKAERRQPRLFAHWQRIAFTSSRTVGAG